MREFIENIKAGSVKASEELKELLAKKVKDAVKEEQKKVARCILIEENVTEELDPGDNAKVWIDDFIKSDAPQFKGKTKEQRINMALAAYYSARKEAGLEESELDEAVKTTHVVIDTANDNVVVGAASDEDGAKRTISSSERPPISIKNKNTLKIVKLRKPAGEKRSMEMIGYPLKENAELEEEALDEATFKNKEVEKRFLAMKKMSTSQLKKIHSDTVGGSTSGMSDDDFINDILLSEFGIKKLSEEVGDPESMSEDEKAKVLKSMLKAGSNKKDAEELIKTHYDYVSDMYRNTTPSKKAEIIVTLGATDHSEQVDLDESVMDQKMWDKIKRGDKLTISYDDSIRGGNKVTLVVVSKNIVGKQRVGKMTMKLADGSSRFKFYIYNRDGKMGLAVGNMAASMTDIVMESKDVEDLKEWGSSDWSGVIRSMDKDLKKTGVNPDTITQAAEDQADFYYDDMGYDSPEDAVPRIIDMWKRNSKTGQKLMAMFSKK